MKANTYLLLTLGSGLAALTFGASIGVAFAIFAGTGIISLACHDYAVGGRTGFRLAY
ncbi:MAG: hypothetical protein ACHQ4G_03520 [Opitutales bacterium]